jgi:uncharacterized membrane protein (Fun14 family)
MSDISTLLTPTNVQSLMSFGGSAGLGAGVGWVVKKVTKVLAKLAVGVGVLYLGSLGYLASQGVISVNWDKLSALISQLTTSATSAATYLVNLGMTVAPGFFLGALAGFAKG